MQRSRIYLFNLALVGAALGACDRPPPADAPVSEMHRYDQAPAIVIGEVRWSGATSDSGATESERAAQAEQVHALLAKLVGMVDRRDLSALPEEVSRDAGLFVDVKAHRTYADLVRELKDPDGYLNTFYLDSAKLAARKNDPDSLAVRDILRLTRTVRADLYMNRQADCEVKLHLVDAPGKSYYLNSPVFIKESGRWYVAQLF
jgi:hypothetical protein